MAFSIGVETMPVSHAIILVRLVIRKLMKIVLRVLATILEFPQLHSQIHVFVTISIMMMVKILNANLAISLAQIASVILKTSA